MGRWLGLTEWWPFVQASSEHSPTLFCGASWRGVPKFVGRFGLLTVINTDRAHWASIRWGAKSADFRRVNWSKR
jgi:hypothetical protein